MKKTKIIAFSGFLGDYTDWDFWHSSLPEQYQLETFCPDPNEFETWSEWCKRFLRENPDPSPALLVGYSLGGRAAAQLLIEAPSRFKGLIAISTHPGLSSIKEREERVRSDQIWADRFSPESAENWSDLMSDWNSQSVFEPAIDLSNRPVKAETAALRLKSMRQLLHMSLGHQEDLRNKLIDVKIPQIWATGALDRKFSKTVSDFSNLAHLRNASTNNMIRWQSVPDVGHRFLWQLSSEHSANILNQWIGELDEKK